MFNPGNRDQYALLLMSLQGTINMDVVLEDLSKSYEAQKKPNSSRMLLSIAASIADERFLKGEMEGAKLFCGSAVSLFPLTYMLLVQAL